MASPGITVLPIRDMTDDEHFCEIYFDDVRVPAANLVGTEGGSFKQVMRQMEHERGGIDRLVSNKRLYQDRLEFARAHGALADDYLRHEAAAAETMYRLASVLSRWQTMTPAAPGAAAATPT